MTADAAPANERLLVLAERLLQRTEAGKISWSRTAEENTFLFNGTSSSVAVEGHVDRDGDFVGSLRVLNERGSEVDTLRTDFGDGAGGRWTPARHNELLRKLHSSARGSALRINEVLDVLLNELEE